VTDAVTLRSARPEDREFLCRVYASTRDGELAVLDWDASQKSAFLQMQFDAQDRYYHDTLTDTTYGVILIDGEPAGRLYVSRWPDEIRVVDIALLPEHRGQAVGTRLLQHVISEGATTGRRVTIHVEHMNPARRLYERLGFQLVEDQGIYLFMELSPPQPPSS
jgi:ribosomal protein S18 acetylase RimI-like enzyme